MMNRLTGLELVNYLSTMQIAGQGKRVVVVGVDGPDCSGKTTISNALTAARPSLWQALHLDEHADPEVLRTDRDVMSLETFLTDYFPTDKVVSAIQIAAERCELRGPSRLVVEGMFLCRPQIRRMIDFM